MISLRTPLLLLLPLASGCARIDQEGIPSLMPRPIETRGVEITTPPLTPPPPADAALSQRLATLQEALAAGQRQFEAVLPSTVRIVRSGAEGQAGEDRWIEAQAAISELQGAQGSTSAVLGAVEELLADHIVANDRGGRREIEALRDEAGRIVSDQLEQIEALRTSLRA